MSQIFGKVVNQWIDMLEEENTPYKKISESVVDTDTWYTIKCNSKVAAWIRTQERLNRWYEHSRESGNWYVTGNVFDVHEELYMRIGLKF